MKWLLISIGWLAAFVLDAQDAEPSGVEQLVNKLAPYEKVSFSFQQQLLSAAGKTLDNAFGKAIMARPNQIRWEVLRPYPQLIVSDGEVVWFYDPDLLQATRRPATYNLTSSIALILLGDAMKINEYFSVKPIVMANKHQAFILKSRDKEVASFKQIELLFYGDKINEMTILDYNQQVTIFTISKVKINPRIAPSTFQFSPPEGVDVNYETSTQ